MSPGSPARSDRHSGAAQSCDGTFDFARIAHIDRAQLHPKRRRRGLDGGQLAAPGGSGPITKDHHSRHAGRNLFEQFQPFPAHAVFESHETGGVAARSRNTCDEAGADRVGGDCEHDRYGAGYLEQRTPVEAPEACMTSGARSTSSAAYLRVSSVLPPVQRVSMCTLLPSVQPNCARPFRSAATLAVLADRPWPGS